MYGCFPATPVHSVSISSTTTHCPIWVDLQLLNLLNPLQFSSKNHLSDVAIAQALLSAHHDCGPAPGVYGDIEVLHLSLDQMRRYTSVALRESKYQQALLNNFLRDAARPPEQPGSALGDCTICVQGIDPQRPLPAKADANGNSQDLVSIQGGIRVAKVRSSLRLQSAWHTFMPCALGEHAHARTVSWSCSE